MYLHFGQAFVRMQDELNMEENISGRKDLP